MLKRLGLLLVTNVLVVITFSVALQFFGVDKYLKETVYVDSAALLVFCTIWGFAGSIVSLLFSKIIAKRVYDIEIIERNTMIPELRALLDEVNRLSSKAGLKTSPDVGIYDSDEVNAFATGPTRNRSLLALSTGLLGSMNTDQIRAVLGHEIGHIANGDMVTMTLIQGTVNSFVLFISRLIASMIYNNLKESTARIVHAYAVFALDIVFTMFGSLIVYWFSRKREYRADEASAEIISPESMINALRFLKAGEGTLQNVAASPLSALKIESGQKKGLFNLFSSHPIIDDRIDNLRKKYNIV